jgi:hypothetical protein
MLKHQAATLKLHFLEAAALISKPLAKASLLGTPLRLSGWDVTRGPQ